MPKFESNKTPPCQLIQRRSDNLQKQRNHDHLIWIKMRFFALFGGVERGERQVRWKNRGFERFIGSVCSFHALQAQRRRCGETLTHIRSYNLTYCIRPRIFSDISLRLWAGWVWAGRQVMACKSAGERMTDLHRRLPLCSTFCPPNDSITQHNRVESPAGFTYGEQKRVRTSALMLLAHNVPSTLPSGVRWIYAKLQLVWKHCGQS